MVALFVVLAALMSGEGASVEVQTLSGEAIAGTLVEFTGDHATVESDGQQVTIPAERMTGISPSGEKNSAGAEAAVWVELVDGTSLAGLDYQARDGQAHIKLTAQKTVDVATRDVVAARIQRASESMLSQWSQIRETEVKADLLVVRKENTLDYHRGVIRGVDDSVVQFELDGETLPVKRTKVLGLVYFQSGGRGLPDMICRLSDTSGSSWAVRSIRSNGDQLEWTTPAGLSASCALADVVRIDFSQGKIAYLGELEPEVREWTPYFKAAKEIGSLAQFFAARVDHALDSGPMLLNGKSYTRGLAMHSQSRVVYRLAGKYRRFKATVGIDDRVRPQGNARLVIRGDDRVLLETTLTGKPTDATVEEVDLDLTGVHRLSILVDYGDDLDIGDHVDLAEARVLK